MDPNQAGTPGGPEALLAVPNLLDTELADIYHLPSMRRLHAAVNTPVDVKGKKKAAPTPTDSTRSGLIMSLHLRFLPPVKLAIKSPDETERRLVLILGYEDGRIDVWGIAGADKEAWRGFTDGSEQVGKRGWDPIWSGKGHNEAGELANLTQSSQRSMSDGHSYGYGSDEGYSSSIYSFSGSFAGQIRSGTSGYNRSSFYLINSTPIFADPPRHWLVLRLPSS